MRQSPKILFPSVHSAPKKLIKKDTKVASPNLDHRKVLMSSFEGTEQDLAYVQFSVHLSTFSHIAIDLLGTNWLATWVRSRKSLTMQNNWILDGRSCTPAPTSAPSFPSELEKKTPFPFHIRASCAPRSRAEIILMGAWNSIKICQNRRGRVNW